MAFRQGPDCRPSSNMALEEPDNQSASSEQALEDELVLALDTIKHLKEQLRERESRRSNNNNITTVERIREDEIGSGRDNGQGRGRPRTPTEPSHLVRLIPTYRHEAFLLFVVLLTSISPTAVLIIALIRGIR